MIQVIVLIGNICSGKTTLAKILEFKGFSFFPVEELKKQLNFAEKDYDADQDVLYEEYAKQIIDLGKTKKLIVESTGANKFWSACLEKIKAEFGSELLTIKIETDKDTCLSRLKEHKEGHRLNTREDLINKIDKNIYTSSADMIIKNNGTKEDFFQQIEKFISSLDL